MMIYNNNYAITLGYIMEKICTKCKQIMDISFFSKDKYKKSGYRTACKQCSNIEYKKFQTSDGYIKRLEKAKESRLHIKQINPIAVWAHDVYHNAKARAKKSGIEFSITKQWVIDNAVKNCPLLGVELIYGAEKSKSKSASIDRKDSARGYTSDNCKIISFKANRIKSNGSLAEIQLLAQNLSKYY